MRKCEIGIILAAGKGTRLSPITRAVPKELLSIGGMPIIDYSIEQMKAAGISKVYIVVGYHKEAVIDYIGNGKRYNINVVYVYQEERKGNANAVLCVEPFVDDTFCVIFGDDYLEPATAMKKLVNFHLSQGRDGAIGVIQAEDARTTGVVKTDQNNRILDIVEKPDTVKFWTNLGSNGTHVFEPTVFDYIRKTLPGLGNEIYLSDTVKTMVKDGRTVYAVKNADFHLDIGVKKKFLEANARIYKNNPR